MRDERRLTTTLPMVVALVGTFGLVACAGPPQKTGLRGYGTPGVAAYMPENQATSLQALLDRCRQVPEPSSSSGDQDLATACGQLHRTLRNQPGNAVPSPSM